MFKRVNCHSNINYHHYRIFTSIPQATGGETNQFTLDSSTKLCTVFGINQEFNPCSMHEARQGSSGWMLLIQCYFLGIRSFEPLKIFSKYSRLKYHTPFGWKIGWFFCRFALENKKKFLLYNGLLWEKFRYSLPDKTNFMTKEWLLWFSTNMGKK